MEEEKLSAKEKAAITRDLFERYRRGETSQTENEIIESLESTVIPEKEFEITDELLDKLETETTDFIFKKVEKPKKRILSPVLIGSVASIALLVIGIFVFYKPQPSQDRVFNKQHIATNSIKNIKLSDGSEIILNSGTTLRETSREVWLEEGEVFFNVKPNNNQPFIVHLRDGLTVKVLGTSFTVQSYSELPFQEISVVSGKVNVSTQNNQSVELIANQQATYSVTEKELSKKSVNGMWKAGWRTGTIVLENATTEELRLRIRQLYNKNIVFESRTDTMSINITLDQTTVINEVADEIAFLYDLSYRITDDKIVFYPKNAEDVS
ncbi:MAG: FecR domain-containing protein [Proteiniphilum sp.]|jgi:ferric-dicitrate binding protein FerR (iron transport regulator)